MRSGDSFFFREDSRGLSVLNTGVPAYTARISTEQLRNRRANVAGLARYAPRPEEIHWFDPGLSNEEELIEELWKAVDNYFQAGSEMPERLPARALGVDAYERPPSWR